MEINVTNDSKNTILGRREIEFTITQDDKTPSKEEVARELCKKLSMSPEATVVVRMNQAYGTKMCMATAHSYPNAEALKKYEQEYLFERVVKKAKKAAGEDTSPAPAKKEAKA